VASEATANLRFNLHHSGAAGDGPDAKDKPAAQAEAQADVADDFGASTTPLSIARSSGRYGDGLDAVLDQEPPR
jgi:hypothetical protein